MKTKLLLTILFLGTQAIVSAQGLKLGDNPGTIDAASLLEMESTSLVFVPTRMTTAQMNAISPLDGAVIYNTTEESLFYYDNGTWSAVGGINEVGNNIFAGSSAGDNTTGVQNAAFGFNAFRSNTTGARNTAVGNFTLDANTTAVNSNAFGFNALRASNANNNNAFGVNALRFNTTGVSNSAFGSNALRENIDGSNNSAFGLSSLQEALGANNSAFGRLALRRLINGNNNVAVGNNAGSLNEDDSFLTDVANSVFIGNVARSQANGQNNQIVIGNGAIGNGANTVTIGNDAISSTFLQGTVNATDMDITGTLTVGGEAIIPGGGGGTDPNVGTNNVFVGNGAGVNTALDATGRENTAMGVAALGSNVTGIRNTAIGTEALFSNVSSEGNTAVGNSAFN